MRPSGAHTHPGTGDGGQVVLIGGGLLAAAAVSGFIIARIWWIVGSTLVAGALAIAAWVFLVRRLARWAERKTAEAYAAQRPAWLAERDARPEFGSARKVIAGTAIRQQAPGAREQAARHPVNRREPSC